MLPIAGAWLFLMPILWAQGTSGEGTGGGLSAAVVYIFCVWMCLIFFAFLFLRAYRQLASDEDGDAIVAVAGDTEAE